MNPSLLPTKRLMIDPNAPTDTRSITRVGQEQMNESALGAHLLQYFRNIWQQDGDSSRERLRICFEPLFWVRSSKPPLWLENGLAEGLVNLIKNTSSRNHQIHYTQRECGDD